ncbi:hypothetical protein SDC9_200368 [bioreactor metagenome]|uniref:Uncharacterized protein n=1 Tax=bioreactor metagenome TaxID=1076179 RepID=A0A645INS9_9ZZZZ
MHIEKSGIVVTKKLCLIARCISAAAVSEIDFAYIAEHMTFITGVFGRFEILMKEHMVTVRAVKLFKFCLIPGTLN